MNRTLLLAMSIVLVGGTPMSRGQKETDPTATPGSSSASASDNSSPPRASRRGSAAFSSGGNTLQYSGGFFTTGSRGDLIPPVMIRFSASDAKASAALEEDLFVMARVISRTLERSEGDKVSYKMNVPMLLTGSGRSVRPMYLEGMGPLFMIKVNFALLPPPKAESKPSAATASDSEWTEAQRDVFGENETEAVVADEASVRSSGYNEDQVEALKNELVRALKNAANIRGLQPEEFVNIAVFGHATPARWKSKAGGANAYVVDGASSKGTVLTLRARKSDIDAFASGQLNTDAFKAKVNMTAYAGSGSGITSINSWIQENAGRVHGAERF